MTLGSSPGDETRTDPDVLLGYPTHRPGSLGDLHLAHGARLRSGTVIYTGSHIGSHLETGHNVVIREECSIGDDVSVWSNTVIDYGCTLGDRVKVHSNCYIAQFTEIADDAFLAPGVTIANDLYPGRLESAAAMSGPLIGVGAQIGVNVTILPFVRIGAGALVGAGSVVTRDIPAGAVAFGNPAVVRSSVEELPALDERIAPVRESARRYRFSGAPQAAEAGARRRR